MVVGTWRFQMVVAGEVIGTGCDVGGYVGPTWFGTSIRSAEGLV